jgi:hypothetical protein
MASHGQPRPLAPVDVTAAVTELVSTDPELRQRVRGLALKALKWAEFDMDHGDPQARAGVIRHLLPAMVRVAAAADDKEKLQSTEAELRQLRADMSTFVLGADHVSSTALEDRPPDPPKPKVAAVPPPRR